MLDSSPTNTLSGYWRQTSSQPQTHERTAERRTKIVCTLGPSSSSPEVIRGLVAAGMDVARLNFSHGTHADHAERIACVRDAEREAGRPIALLADLCGPKIRVAGLLQPHEAGSGDRIALGSIGVGHGADLAISFEGLADCVAVGDPVLIDDGRIRLRAAGMRDGLVLCDVELGGTILPNKGVNLPQTTLPVSTLTAKDIADLAFALDHGVDVVALSFARTAEDVLDLRRRIAAAGSRALTMAKVEKAEAVSDLEAIVDAADAVMVARGDLGVEIGVARVPLVQKQIIDAARAAGRAVVTATQMLESMIEHPEPTRAEASDVANAIIDGTSAVMLSAETASGRYPIEAVETLDTIARDVEPTLTPGRRGEPAGEALAVLATAACEIGGQMHAALVAVPTETGATAREIARCRPMTPVVAASSDETVLRQLALEWGVRPIAIPEVPSAEMLWTQILAAVCANDLASEGDTVVFAGRTDLALPGTTTHLLLHRVAAAP
jgi:pyruvate kinase